MTIELARDVEAFLEQPVRDGVCQNASDLVNDVLRAMKAAQAKPFETTPELEAWLLTAAEQPASPLTDLDFESIRQRAASGQK